MVFKLMPSSVNHDLRQELNRKSVTGEMGMMRHVALRNSSRAGNRARASAFVVNRISGVADNKHDGASTGLLGAVIAGALAIFLLSGGEHFGKKAVKGYGGVHLAVSAGALSPEILEPIGRHLGVAGGMHDALMAEIMLKRPGIMPIVGELVPAGVPEHVRVNREWHLGSLTEPLDEPVEADGAHRSAAL
jgi:hypothetical protein